MIGFILAAGFGTRLRPITDHIPKALVPVCGEPLLGRAIDFLRAQGMERIAVNAHHHPDQMEAFLHSGKQGCAFFHETGRIRGTGGALYFAKEFLALDDAFCVANVDIVAAVDLRKLRAAFSDLNCSAGLVAIPCDNGTVLYNAQSKDYIGARSEASSGVYEPGGRGAGAEFLGIAFYKREMLAVLDEADFSVLPVWKRMQGTGMSVKIVETPPVYWKDLGTPSGLAAIHFDALDGTCEMRVPPNLVVDKEGKRAYPRSLDPAIAARLGPYSWVDTDVIPATATLSRTVVFKDAAISEGTVLKNAIVTSYGVIPLVS